MPLSDDEKKGYGVYIDALGHGREATRKKDAKGAIKAFDEAYAAKPGDARAQGERGYARFLAKDNEGALKDLYAARVRAVSPDVEAQIWMNVGLVEDALHHDEAARYAYTRVQSMRPSSRAGMRLIGQSTCDARIERAVKPGKTYAGWLAAWRGFEAQHVAAWREGAKPKVATDDDAQKAICGTSCTGGGPWIVQVGDPEVAAEYAFVAPRDGNKLLVFHHVGDALGGACPWTDEVTLDPGAPMHVRVKSRPRSLQYLKPDALGELHECESEVKACSKACIAETWSERDYYFDVDAGSQIFFLQVDGRPLGIDPDRYTRTVGVARKPDAIYVRGGGCDLTVRLDKPDGG
jgi:hypothetical protein